LSFPLAEILFILRTYSLDFLAPSNNHVTRTLSRYHVLVKIILDESFAWVDTLSMSSGHTPRTPLGDQISEKLRDDICSLTLRPNLKLTSQSLVERFAIGQSPIREALSTLTGEGLVVRESRRGFRVLPMSLNDFDQLTSTRLVMETSLLRWALTSPSSDWAFTLKEALNTMILDNHKVGDTRPVDRHWEKCHRHFHFSLINAYASPYYLEFCQRIYNFYDRYRTLGIPRRAFLAVTAEDHREISDSALSLDITKATNILVRHLDDTSNAIRSNIEMSGYVGKGGVITLPDTTNSDEN